MVEVHNLVGTGIAPVSKKTAVKRHFAALYIRELENWWFRFLMSRTGYSKIQAGYDH